MNTLYIYTTKSDRKKGYYKFGQTSNTAENRVTQQQTGNSELLELIYFIEVCFVDMKTKHAYVKKRHF